MHNEGVIGPTGRLGLRVFHQWPANPTFLQMLWHGFPRPGLDEGVAMWRLRNLPHLWRGMWRVLLHRAVSRITHIPSVYGALWLDKITPHGRVQLGLASMRLVTNNGAGYLVDALQNLTEAENLKFHAFGVGTNAEAAADSALQTEETTQYNPDSTRPTGSLTEASAQVFRTVGTYSPDSGTSPRPITEHGIMSQAATGGGTLLDRSVFSVVNLVTNADSLQTTYDFTINSGG